MPLSNTGEPTGASLASSETRLQWLRGQEQRNEAALCEMTMGPSVRPLGSGLGLQGSGFRVQVCAMLYGGWAACCGAPCSGGMGCADSACGAQGLVCCEGSWCWWS